MAEYRLKKADRDPKRKIYWLQRKTKWFWKNVEIVHEDEIGNKERLMRKCEDVENRYNKQRIIPIGKIVMGTVKK